VSTAEHFLASFHNAVWEDRAKLGYRKPWKAAMRLTSITSLYCVHHAEIFLKIFVPTDISAASR
jgi:hypothetical protein